MSKTPRSFSIDEELADAISEREDLNASGAVNTFLREYLSGGRGAEAAIEVRISQLDEEIADLEKDLERKRRERDRLEGRIQDKRDAMDEVVNNTVAKIRNDEFPRENLNADNLAVQNWASDAGVETDRFINEVEARL